MAKSLGEKKRAGTVLVVWHDQKKYIYIGPRKPELASGTYAFSVERVYIPTNSKWPFFELFPILLLLRAWKNNLRTRNEPRKIYSFDTYCVYTVTPEQASLLMEDIENHIT